MKIGIMGTRGIPNEYGGFEQMTEYLSRGLAGRGHEVYVYNPHHHSYKYSSWGAVKIIHKHDPVFLGTAGQFIYDLNCIHDARKRNFNILLHLGYTSDAIWSFRWPSKTIHLVNMDGMEWKRAKYNSLSRWFLKWSESMVVRKASQLIADSPGIKQYLLNSYKKNASYIPYAAEIFTGADPVIPRHFGVMPGTYSLIIARMEPENNIELVIKGHQGTGQPLLIIGNIQNKYGRNLQRKYKDPFILFSKPEYAKRNINNLRFYSKIYFHGHSAGGTNPSLLEAMGCGCRIAAHDNIFNKAVAGEAAQYFLTSAEVSNIIYNTPPPGLVEKNKESNMQKIREIYTPENMISAYEELMLESLSSNPVPGLLHHSSSHQIARIRS